MTDQYSGECIVRLMNQAGKILERPRPQVEIVPRLKSVVRWLRLMGRSIALVPEIIEGMKQIEAETLKPADPAG